ncbi:hypothetical protein B0I33_105520 [Prauserella shujinwangii]|uniref:PE family protein n=1 Tax=Prauserella shujinwangii TaxID=1453103 RepID=A0A2T0LVT8_9PSEU|nr:hypothetical protein [Prauserella shujinwangii]PRX47936.1 hypothetical protein B0I33_105520 [Prauserella shujinwangii]
MPFVPDSGSAIGAGIGAAMPAMSAKALQATSAETQKLIAAAESGGFRISEEGLRPLREALLRMRTQVNDLRQSAMFDLSQAPKLGSHDYGEAVAQHDQKGASGSAGSASAVLEQFTRVLMDADEALAKAAGVYRESENTAADNIGSVQA